MLYIYILGIYIYNHRYHVLFSLSLRGNTSVTGQRVAEVSLATCETFDLTQVLRCHLQQLEILETHGASDGPPLKGRGEVSTTRKKQTEKAMENGEIWDFIWIYMGMIWDIMDL